VSANTVKQISGLNSNYALKVAVSSGKEIVQVVTVKVNSVEDRDTTGSCERKEYSKRI